MPLEQIIILAVVQGITEFLPISSSGHLILIPALSGWPDQGLVTDVMVHVGSLFAIIVYFWRDVIKLFKGAWHLLRFNFSAEARLLLFIAVATVPAIVVGVVFKLTGFLDHIRGIEIVAWNAIIFGVILYLADRLGLRMHKVEDMRFGPAMIIGFAQALALIPGTSRSGITITAARGLGFERAEAARFSFLLGIPAIAGAGLLTVVDLHKQGLSVPPDALLAAGLTFFSAIAAIAFLMTVIRRMSFLPFVLYRLALGAFLLVLAYG